ncbi:MAG TPA: hypothetical protein VG165_03755 [Solirubrobacteraceae bacterium]|nr:hypothetical protein [Solirubrobacteraceae bacterium]
MPTESLGPPRILVDGVVRRCTTTLSYAGMHQLTLASAMPDLSIELHSTYLGHRLHGYIATAHAARVLGQPTRVYCAPDGAAELPVGQSRRSCLLNHLDQLSILVTETTGFRVAIDIDDAALDRMDAT